MKIIITGASGFIGQNLSLKYKNALKVDFNKTIFEKEDNSILDPFEFLDNFDSLVQEGDVIIHNGACSSTTVSDPFYVNKVNFEYSQKLLKKCLNKKVRLIYASSASVYGDGPFNEKSLKNPKNLYALSKSLFDDYASQFSDFLPQLVGLRYFNVYGPYEHNKSEMASVAFKFFNQIKQKNKIILFKNSEKYLRDFVFVEDILKITEFFIENPNHSGIFNCGTGEAKSFQNIADIFIKKYKCEIDYVEMPKKLVGKYQKFTKSDNSKLNLLYDNKRIDLEEGILKYLDFLEGK